MAKKKEAKSRGKSESKDTDINGDAEIIMKKDADHKLNKNEDICFKTCIKSISKLDKL